MAYDLLTSSPRTGCQSIIVFVTDGKDTDAESVWCGPGKLYNVNMYLYFIFNAFTMRHRDIKFYFLFVPPNFCSLT